MSNSRDFLPQKFMHIRGRDFGIAEHKRTLDQLPSAAIDGTANCVTSVDNRVILVIFSPRENNIHLYTTSRTFVVCVRACDGRQDLTTCSAAYLCAFGVSAEFRQQKSIDICMIYCPFSSSCTILGRRHSSSVQASFSPRTWQRYICICIVKTISDALIFKCILYYIYIYIKCNKNHFKRVTYIFAAILFSHFPKSKNLTHQRCEI